MTAALHHRKSQSKRDIRRATYARWPLATWKTLAQFTCDGLRLTGPNERLHWRTKAAGVEKEHAAVFAALYAHHRDLMCTPVHVTIVRIGKRDLDDDNLAGASKAVRDAVSDWLGTGDGPSDPVTWECKQERGEYAVRVEVRCV